MPEQPTRTYQWTAIGGHLALDLCNTVSWRLDPARRIDRLATASHLIDWFATIGGAASGIGADERERLFQCALDDPKSAEKALRAMKDLREATFRVICHQLGQPTTSAADTEMQDEASEDAWTTDANQWTRDTDQIAATWRHALAVATTPQQLPWQWRIAPTEPADLVQVLALAVADLLQRPDLSRLRRCDGEGCGWLFLDATRNHSRRWCDPFDCGNRARVRSYAERHRPPRTS